jgi:hypothetical protein
VVAVRGGLLARHGARVGALLALLVPGLDLRGTSFGQWGGGGGGSNGRREVSSARSARGLQRVRAL